MWRKGLILAPRVQNSLPASPVSSLQWFAFCVCAVGKDALVLTVLPWHSLSFPGTAHQTCTAKYGPAQQAPERCDENRNTIQQKQNGGGEQRWGGRGHVLKYTTTQYHC